MLDTALVSLNTCLEQLQVRAWRLHLETPNVAAHVPMLRGVWGAALHDIDPPLYRYLFAPPGEAAPLYLIRPAPAEIEPSPALEFFLFGRSTTEMESRIWQAWDLALRRGLGKDRIPARLTDIRPLAWDGTALQSGYVQPGFRLAGLPWPLNNLGDPCRLVFTAPLRLMRHRQLILQPTLADLTASALRRIAQLEPATAGEIKAQNRAWLDLSWSVTATPWQGEPLDLVRYSASQRDEIEMRGVAGELYLPQGPGPLVDLLLAMTWMHVGKGTVMGLGHLNILPEQAG